MEILCLDHCQMTDSMCKNYFATMQNTNLQFLNISWNKITGISIDYITRVVQQNQDLEKLTMQHNRLGEADLTEFSNTIATHKSLKHLDMSANMIGNEEFSLLFTAVQKSSSIIETFACRKNRIGGLKIDHLLFCRSRNLHVLDLSHNRLSDSNGLSLLKYARLNVTVEKIYLDNNFLISPFVIREIDEECR